MKRTLLALTGLAGCASLPAASAHKPPDKPPKPPGKPGETPGDQASGLPAAGRRVRLRGKVCPEHDGGTLQIQRRKAPKQWRTVAQVTMADAGTCSSFAHRLRVRRDGAFRTLFEADSDHAAARSRVRRIDVR